MNVVQLINNATTFVTSLGAPLGAFGAVAAGVLYGAGHVTDNPRMNQWGKKSAIGAIVLFSVTAVSALIHSLATSIVG